MCHWLALREGGGVGVNNILLRLCLPLLPPALVGFLVGVLVGVGTRRRVEAIAHPLAISAPPHPVVPELNGHSVPFGEVVWSPFPAKYVWEVLAAAFRDLVPD